MEGEVVDDFDLFGVPLVVCALEDLERIRVKHQRPALILDVEEVDREARDRR